MTAVDGVRIARLHHRPFADVLVLSGVAAVVGVLLGTEQARALLPPSAVDLLTLAAAGVGAGSAMLAVFAARLLDDRGTAWIAAALALYSGVVLPWSTSAVARSVDGPHRPPMLVVYLAAMVLLVLSVRPPRRLGGWGGWVVAAVGAALGLLALALPPSTWLRDVTQAFVPTVAVLVGWTAAGVAFAVAGFRARSAPRWRLGLGLALLAVSQLMRAASAAPPGQSTAFAGLRLLGLAVVLIGLLQMVQEGLGRVQSRDWAQQEEIATAALHLQRAQEIAAERDHELRNGLASLAGIATLLSGGAGRQHEGLRRAVLAELDRLLALVDPERPDPAPDVAAPGPGYPVAQVLADRAALRASAAGPSTGPLELRMEAGVRAAGSPDLLAQVLTNLLANCDRHAPGAPVTVSARQRGGRVVVEVRDEGPGLPEHLAGAVLERGVRDEAADGQGVGLAVSARLLAAAGGELAVRTVTDPDGCLATVTLPAVTEFVPIRPLVDEDGPSAVSSAVPDNR